MLGYDELEDGIAQKLKALVIEMLLLFFVSNTRMRERLSQEMRIPKLITDALFERMHVWLGGRRAVRLFFVNANGSDHVDGPLQDGVVQGRTFSAAGAFSGLRRIDFGIGAGEESGFIQMRPIGFKNESGHAFR